MIHLLYQKCVDLNQTNAFGAHLLAEGGFALLIIPSLIEGIARSLLGLITLMCLFIPSDEAWKKKCFAFGEKQWDGIKSAFKITYLCFIFTKSLKMPDAN